MKRTFLKFPARPVRYAPTITSRRLRLGLSRANIAYKSDAPADPADPIDPATKEVEAIKEIGKQVEAFRTLLGDKADKNEFENLKKQLTDLQSGISEMKAAEIVKAIEAINKANESIHKQIVEMQEKAAEDRENGTTGKGKKASFLSTKQVEDFIKATFGDNKSKTKNDAKIEIGANKAAENFSTATFFEGGADTDPSAFTGRFIDPTLYQRRRKTNLILDYFNIQTITVPELVFLVKVEDGDDVDSLSGDSGSAEWILCGDEKPKRSFRVTTGRVEAKKVAIFGTVEDCLLQDVASLERWIREDFRDEMFEAINDGLLNNNPAVDPNAPEGLLNNATQFTATPGYNNEFAANSTNYIDQLIAAFATMRYRREEPAIAFVASDVWYLIHHLKDSDGRYQNSNLVYTNTLGQVFIAGVLIVAADQEDIDSDHVLVVGRDLGFKIYAYGPMVFERGLNADDFRHDRTSFRGYQRFLSFMPTHRENSVLYDTWANIKAGIEA
jgi:HK97 family phage major capsid protein